MIHHVPLIRCERIRHATYAAQRPVMYDDHLIPWKSHQQALRGGLDRQPRRGRVNAPPMTPDEVKLLDELRPTHTLAQLAKIFGRHPTTLAQRSAVKVDFRRRPDAQRKAGAA